VLRSKAERARIGPVSARALALGVALTAAVAALVVLWTRGGDSEPAGSGRAIAAGATPEKAIWGPVRLPNGRSAFPVYDRLGVDVFQIQLQWSEVAPRRPSSPTDPRDHAYRWPADLDRAVREAADRGIRLAILTTTTPGWANRGAQPVQAPDDPSDYADFLAAAARRYPSVRLWMIWGEPNRSDRFLPNEIDSPVGPRRYAELLDASYEALKEASPDNVVIGGMTWTGGDVRPPDFLRWLRLPSGEPPRLDWYGHNPYPFRFPDLHGDPYPGGWRDLSDLDTLSTEVSSTYASRGIDPPLWLSEFTVQSDHPSSVLKVWVSRDEQARWLRAGYRAAEQAGDVAGLGWFTLLDQPDTPDSGAWGLMTAEGEAKPAFSAYESLDR
jgi:hypothetical protein